MKIKKNIQMMAVLLALVLAACGGNNEPAPQPDPPPAEDNDVPAEDSDETDANQELPTVSLEDLTGSYEGEWAMSPHMKPLASLVIKDDMNYAFFLSITGLMEEGTFTIEEDFTVVFTSNEGQVTEGRYDEGFLTANFKINNDPTEIEFMQVGSPIDVYNEFLGHYLTQVMGRTDVTIGLRPGGKYINYFSQEQGTFRIANGQITLIPNDSELPSVTGEISLRDHTIEIEMSVMPGTPVGQLTFQKIPQEDQLIYIGESSVGMGGSTMVTLTILPGNVFNIETTAPRGTGVFEVIDENGTNRINLIYLDPPTRLDGSPFIMVGVTEMTDLSDPSNVITMETIEYIVRMGEDFSILNLQEVEFTLQGTE